MSLPQLVIASFETAFNQYIALDPEAMLRFENLEGRIIALEILGLNETIYLFPGADGIMVLADYDGEADTVLSGTPVALARLSLQKNAMPVLFSGEVTIRGDIRLGQQFKKILGGLNIDWEEQLSRVSGDMLAHQIGNGLRNIKDWFARSQKSCELDIGEYLQEESQLLPAVAEIEKFIRDVDQLRSGIDRLEARIARIKNKE